MLRWYRVSPPTNRATTLLQLSVGFLVRRLQGRIATASRRQQNDCYRRSLRHEPVARRIDPPSAPAADRPLGSEIEVLDFDHHGQQVADIETVQLQHAVVFNFVVDDLDSVVAFGQSLGPVQDLV